MRGKQNQRNIGRKREIKTEIDTIKKTLKEITLESEHQKKKSGVTEASISNRLQEI